MVRKKIKKKEKSSENLIKAHVKSTDYNSSPP